MKTLSAVMQTYKAVGIGEGEADETLARGFAIIRAEADVVTSAQIAAKAPLLEVEFADGRLPVQPAGTTAPTSPAQVAASAPLTAKPAKPKPTKPEPAKPEQGSLF